MSTPNLTPDQPSSSRAQLKPDIDDVWIDGEHFTRRIDFRAWNFVKTLAYERMVASGSYYDSVLATIDAIFKEEVDEYVYPRSLIVTVYEPASRGGGRRRVMKPISLVAAFVMHKGMLYCSEVRAPTTTPEHRTAFLNALAHDITDIVFQNVQHAGALHGLFGPSDMVEALTTATIETHEEWDRVDLRGYNIDASDVESLPIPVVAIDKPLEFVCPLDIRARDEMWGEFGRSLELFFTEFLVGNGITRDPDEINEYVQDMRMRAPGDIGLVVVIEREKETDVERRLAVACVCFSNRSSITIGIGPAYTDRAYRNKGCAAFAVYHLMQRHMNMKRTAVFYTDVKNVPAVERRNYPALRDVGAFTITKLKHVS